MFELFNFYHWSHLFCTFIIILIFDRILLNLNRRKQYIIIFILSVINFLLHFFKVYTDGIDGVKNQIYYISLSNFCSINTVILPFVLIFKNKRITDFMSIMCLVSGIIAMLFCYCLEGENGVSNHTVRFFITHLLIFLIPFELLRYNHVSISYKSVKWCYVFFFIEQGIIYLNDIILFNFNIIPYQYYSNSSLVYGVRNDVDEMFGFIRYLVPNVFIINGEYIPVFWLMVPVLLVTILTYFIVIIFFDRNGFNNDYKEYRLRRVLKKYNL